MLASIGQTVAAALLVGGAACYLALALRRWLKGQGGETVCCGRGACRSRAGQPSESPDAVQQQKMVSCEHLNAAAARLAQGRSPSPASPSESAKSS